ncbi:zinc finger protein 69 homolog B-like isoform X1 [Gadus macrocephalus]|uniref:zinc finger protein 69 homolog B-like isoform X1 n=1 Tax=Gadus macrocephalus TaxID=80720 RepID=UPI0028CB3ECF|nr:zinc finger protein 69 homolog B-like isoform X1 [Gadus macrocephalus]
MADKTPPPPPPAPANRRKSIFERAIDNKNAEREKQKSRVILGAAFPRWRQLKDGKSLKTDACVAFFLLDSYDKWCSVVSNIQEGSVSDCCRLEKAGDRHRTGGSEINPTTNMSYEEGCTGITFDISEITFAADEDSDCSNQEAVGEEEEDEETEETEGSEDEFDDSDQEWGKCNLSESEFSDSDQLEKDGSYENKCLSEVRKKVRELCPDCGGFFTVGKPHTCEYKIKPILCNVCGKRLKDEAALKSHSRIHTEDYRHFCKFCMEPFKTRIDKLTHQRAHVLNQKPYKCPDCAMTFSKLRARNFHLKEHRGPNSVSCPHCALVFPAPHCLKRHMLVHTGERQFVCEFCSRSFNQHGHLKSHLRLHTGEKPYQCQHCDKSFNHNVSLKSHIMRYHNATFDSGTIEHAKETTEKIELTAPKIDEMNDEMSTEDTGEVVIDEDPTHEEEPKKQIKKTYHRSTGRPKGRPKRNAATEEFSLISAVQGDALDRITAAEPSEECPLKLASSKDTESDWSDRDQTSEHTEEDEAEEIKGRKRKARQTDSDSEFDPSEAKQRRKSLQKPGNVGGRRGRPRNSRLV